MKFVCQRVCLETIIEFIFSVHISSHVLGEISLCPEAFVAELAFDVFLLDYVNIEDVLPQECLRRDPSTAEIALKGSHTSRMMMQSMIREYS